MQNYTYWNANFLLGMHKFQDAEVPKLKFSSRQSKYSLEDQRLFDSTSRCLLSSGRCGTLLVCVDQSYDLDDMSSTGEAKCEQY